jgi:zona occludens toxin
MIEYTVGVPGSGKTYRVQYILYSNFGLDKNLIDSKFIHNDINFAYTNINEIKIEEFENGSIKKLDWDLFKESLEILFAMYKDKVTDSELIEKAKELSLFECLIIIDECHNYLDIQDKILVWWLSYHRHLHQQIYLITQNLALVNSKYKTFSEFFYVAKPSSLKMFKNKMVYSQFTNSRLSQVSKSGVIKIPFIKKIFDSYHSGANQQSENLLKKFAFIGLGFFVLLIVMILGIQAYLSKDIEIPKENKIIDSHLINSVEKNLTSKNLNPINEDILIDDDELKLFNFKCINNFCFYQFEDNQTIKIPSNILKTYLLNINETKKYFELKKNILNIYVLVNENTFNFIYKSKKRVKNEKDNNKSFTDTFNFNK